jgi:hypothetical protein
VDLLRSRRFPSVTKVHRSVCASDGAAPTDRHIIEPVLRFDGRVPKPSPLRDPATRTRALTLIGLLALTLTAAIAAAAAQRGWVTVVALAASAAVEFVLARRSPFAVALMRRAGAGRPTRAAIQMLAVVLLAGRCLQPAILIGTTVTAVVIVVVAIAADAARVVVVRVRRLPLVTRNLDLGDFALPKPAPALAMDPRGLDSVAAVVAAIGLAIAMHHGGSTTDAAIALALATALAALPAALLGAQVVTLVRAKLRTRLTDAATTAIETLVAEVILYFAATPEEIYQVRMWLEPLARLDQRVVVVLRSHEVFEALGDVDLPVICTPFNGTIASLPFPPRVVALFVTHSGNNLAMLRRPEVRSAFVGHGDSDKPDSVNPFARVYDEVWVAGPLGRRRYEDAGIGVADAAIVEVGRPQIRPSGAPLPQPPTIVYAPTWEGWGDDPHHSSLAHIGPMLIERLTARGDIRVRYRPHPLTGRRSPALRAAHQQIIELVGRVPEDESLADTFARSSGLIGDVSSVVNEYLPYDRPYAVVDTRDLGEVDFVQRFRSTAGGFVLPADLTGLDDFVAAALGGPDPTASSRHQLLEAALGDPATSQQRFADAVSRLLR